MPSHQQVLEFIKQHGPVTPNDVRQGLKLQDNFLAGALLSELVEQGKLNFSNLSHGTSKFYYDPEQPETLEAVSQFLGEKDQKAYQLLKKEQVVRAADLTPLMRVAVMQVKDYSRQLILGTPEGEQEFYRYYLIAQEEAVALIKKKYFGMEEKPAEQLKQQEKPAETPAPEQKPEKTKPKQRTKPAQKTLETGENGEFILSGFAKQVRDYFDTKQITLLNLIEAKKTEFSAVVSVPSAVGSVHYFCKAKAKKSTNDGDLAAAVLEAQQHKLPLLYIAAGSLTKKAQELLNNQLKGAIVVQPWA